LVEKALSLREELEISLEDNGYLFPSMDQYGNVRKNNTIYRGMDWQWKKIKKFEPTLAEHRLKDLRSGWVTFGVRTLKYDKDTIAKANGRADVGTMDRHYLAAPKTRDAFNNVAAGISQLREQP
jgi:hypothetical protein